MKRLLVLLAAIAALVVASAAPSNAASTAAGSVDSDFGFCNTTGGTIACFSAHLHYENRTTFYLANIGLEDTLCDSRSVYADVWDQNLRFTEYSDTKGCGTDTYIAGPISFHDPSGVDYVQVVLIACNTLSCSSAAYSAAHYNPYY